MRCDAIGGIVGADQWLVKLEHLDSFLLKYFFVQMLDLVVVLLGHNWCMVVCKLRQKIICFSGIGMILKTEEHIKLRVYVSFVSVATYLLLYYVTISIFC